MVQRTPKQIAAIKRAKDKNVKSSNKQIAMLNTGSINADLVNIEYKLKEMVKVL